MTSIEINHKELKEYISRIWTNKISLNLTGTTGIGKSVSVWEQAKEIAKKEKREFIEWNKTSKEQKNDIITNPEKYFIFMDIRLSQFDATDLKGLPKIDTDTVVEWLIQNWLFALTNENTKAVLFFDEMNLAPPSVLASAYQIIRDRCIGDVKLGDNVLIISAGNTLEDRANVFEMAKPLCNRFIHATLLPPDLESWTEWALRNGVDDRIIAFLHFKPDNLFTFQPDSPDQAFATPRSWAEYCSEMIKGLEHGNPMFQKFVASSVGTGVAVEFSGWCNLRDKVDFQAILKNPKLIEDIEELDIQYSLVSMITEYLKGHHDQAGCDKFLEMLQFLQPEFAILSLKFAVERHYSSITRYFQKNKLWKEDLGKEYSKYLVG